MERAKKYAVLDDGICRHEREAKDRVIGFCERRAKDGAKPLAAWHLLRIHAPRCEPCIKPRLSLPLWYFCAWQHD